MRCRQNGGRNVNYKDFSATYLLRRYPEWWIYSTEEGPVSSCWSARQVKGVWPPLDGYPFFQLHHRAGMIMLEGIIVEKSRAWNIIKWLFAESSQVHLFPDYPSTPRTDSKVRLYISSLALLIPDYHKIQKRKVRLNTSSFAHPFPDYQSDYISCPSPTSSLIITKFRNEEFDWILRHLPIPSRIIRARKDGRFNWINCGLLYILLSGHNAQSKI